MIMLVSAMVGPGDEALLSLSHYLALLFSYKLYSQASHCHRDLTTLAAPGFHLKILLTSTEWVFYMNSNSDSPWAKNPFINQSVWLRILLNSSGTYIYPHSCNIGSVAPKVQSRGKRSMFLKGNILGPLQEGRNIHVE